MNEDGVYIGFGPDWDAVNALGGDAKIFAAHHIARRYMESGSVGMRIWSRGGSNDWALPILAAENCPVIVGLGWNGLWDRPGTEADHVTTWLGRHAMVEVQRYHPRFVFVDQEHVPNGARAQLDMVGKLRNIVDVEVGPEVPIYYYRGDALFFPGVGSGRSPRLYQWWNKQAEMELLPVDDGAPWGSPYVDAWHLDKGLVDLEPWEDFCFAMGASTAKYISLYPSPYGKFASLGSPRHEQILRYMTEGAEAFRAERKERGRYEHQ